MYFKIWTPKKKNLTELQPLFVRTSMDSNIKKVSYFNLILSITVSVLKIIAFFFFK